MTELTRRYKSDSASTMLLWSLSAAKAFCLMVVGLSLALPAGAAAEGVSIPLVVLAPPLMGIGLYWLSARAQLALAERLAADADDKLAAPAFALFAKLDAAALEDPTGPAGTAAANHAALADGFGPTVHIDHLDAYFAPLFLAALAFASPLAALATLAGMAALFLVARRLHQTPASPKRQAPVVLGALDAAKATAEQKALRRGIVSLGRVHNDLAFAAHAALAKSRADRAGRDAAVGLTLAALACVLAATTLNEGTSVQTIFAALFLSCPPLFAAQALAKARVRAAAGEAAFATVREFFGLPREAGKRADARALVPPLVFESVCGKPSPDAPPLFEDISFTLKGGSLAVVAGSDGSGKTFLCRMVMGLAKPASGRMHLGGVDLESVGPADRAAAVGYAPQEGLLLGDAVRDTLLVANPGLDDKGAAAALHMVDATRFLQGGLGLDQTLGLNGRLAPASLKRRLAAAQALVRGPAVVVLDDPTLGLDDSGRAALVALVKKLLDLDKAVLVASRDPGLIALAELVVDLDAGAVLAREGAAVAENPA